MGIRKRALDQRFVDDLREPGVLSPIRKLVENDHTLCMEFRGDMVEIYYRGGSFIYNSE